ncbi:MAG: hypothetical protein ACETWG_00645 [Candidatus Neomarinimicrobiota bacterium]
MEIQAKRKADAWHHCSDAISSLLMLAAVAGSTLGYPALDGMASGFMRVSNLIF